MLICAVLIAAVWILLSCYVACCRKHRTTETALGTAGENAMLEALVPVVEQKEASACQTAIFQALLRRAELQVEGPRISGTAWTVDTIGLVLQISPAAAIFESGLSGKVEEFIKTVAMFEAVAATNSVFVRDWKGHPKTSTIVLLPLPPPFSPSSPSPSPPSPHVAAVCEKR